MVRAGSPGIRWIMKKQMIVTPMATGTSCSSRWNTNVIRPMARLTSSRARRARSARGAGWAGGSAPVLLAQPDVLHVVVAERRDEEAVHVRGGGVGVGRVVEEGHERVRRRLGLDVVVQRLPARRGQGLLRIVRGLDDAGVVVGGEEGLGPRARVDRKGGELIRVGDVHGP